MAICHGLAVGGGGTLTATDTIIDGAALCGVLVVGATISERLRGLR